MNHRFVYRLTLAPLMVVAVALMLLVVLGSGSIAAQPAIQTPVNLQIGL